MLPAFAALAAGLVILALSADRFVDGAVGTAHHLRMPPLLIGMLVVGFGTSAPEMVVSLFAALDGNAGIALGNAYGSNIANIALILGFTALMKPIAVESRVLRKELPILTAVTALAAWQLVNGRISRLDALVLVGVFVLVMGWSIREGLGQRSDAFGSEMAGEIRSHPLPLGRAVVSLALGLVLLVVSSRVLVWGAVEIARGVGVSDLVIGLTVVAIGTSLPELAASLSAARKGEGDLALGNVLGSNLFNTLLVVGIAGLVGPIEAGAEVLRRDAAVMGALTLSLFVIGYGFTGPGRINRVEGGLLLACYAGYTAWLVVGIMG